MNEPDSIFKIDKAIPLVKGNLGKSRYPFRSMQIGDSFSLAESQRTKVAASACGFSRRNPEFTFTIRKVEGGFRCWRIETKPA